MTRLPELYVSLEAAEGLRADAARLPVWRLTPRQRTELALLVGGGLYPLRGYMSEAEHATVGLGADGCWPESVTLAVDADFAVAIAPGQDIALHFAGDLLAILSVTDKWQGRGDLLGGRVKALPRVQIGPTPNDLRGRFHGAARVLAEPLAGGLDFHSDDGGVLRLDLPSGTGPLAAARIARNCGATHVLLRSAQDRALLDPQVAGLGLQIVAG